MDAERHSERGQTIILVVLGLAALLGLTALAVDGGITYFDRRGAQNAADAAALAGARALVSGQDWSSAALSQAASNGYDNNGMTNVVEVHNPPVHGPYAGDSEGVQVILTSTARTAFVQFVFGGPLRNTVEAVARGREHRNIAPGYALYGASPTDCSTIWFAGTQATNVTGGGVFSNSTASIDTCTSGKQNGSGSVTVTGGGIQAAGSFKIAGGSGTVSPPPQEYMPQQDLPDVPIPDCSGLPSWGSKVINKPAGLKPGIYSRISLGGQALVSMDPGMYCVTDSQGFQAQAGATLTGDGVFIYMQTGPFDMAGGAHVVLTATTYLVDASGNQWGGMLLYMDPNNKSGVGIRGNSGSTYSGTIYGRSSDCELAGTGDTLVVSSQIICNTIKLSGNAVLDINYDQATSYMMPFTVDLTQ